MREKPHRPAFTIRFEPNNFAEPMMDLRKSFLLCAFLTGFFFMESSPAQNSTNTNLDLAQETNLIDSASTNVVAPAKHSSSKLRVISHPAGDTNSNSGIRPSNRKSAPARFF